MSERTPQQWQEWWEAFKKRNGLDRSIPHPPENAPPPPKPHSDTDRDEETQP